MLQIAGIHLKGLVQAVIGIVHSNGMFVRSLNRFLTFSVLLTLIRLILVKIHARGISTIRTIFAYAGTQI